MNLKSKIAFYSANLIIDTDSATVAASLGAKTKCTNLQNAKTMKSLNENILNMLKRFESTISEYTRGVSQSLRELLSKPHKNPKELKFEKALSIYRTTKEIGNEERKRKHKDILQELEDKIFNDL